MRCYLSFLPARSAALCAGASLERGHDEPQPQPSARLRPSPSVCRAVFLLARHPQRGSQAAKAGAPRHRGRAPRDSRSGGSEETRLLPCLAARGPAGSASRHLGCLAGRLPRAAPGAAFAPSSSCRSPHLPPPERLASLPRPYHSIISTLGRQLAHLLRCTSSIPNDGAAPRRFCWGVRGRTSAALASARR
jgi:hypothetical protein